MEDIKFINDKIVKKILTSEEEANREYLVRIISGVTGIDSNTLKNNIKLVTTEVCSNINTVNSIVDAIFNDNEEYINIEINYNYSKTTIIKNNVYLYHVILRQLNVSKDYSKILPAIQININNFDLFKKGDFIYRSEMMEMDYHIVRDKMLTIYDINLDFLRNIDYNKIKKGHISDLKKILYVFICDDKKKLDDIYAGDCIMEKVRENIDRITWEKDRVLFYDPEDLNRQIIEEKVEEKVEEKIKEIREEMNKERKLTIKNMLENNVPDNLIIKYLNIDEELLNKVKEELL